MPKINREEYEVLKELDDEWKYLARNNMYGAKLEAHTSRPYKMTDSHWSNGDMTLELLGGEHLFQFIQWEDESPYNIAELIEEYEIKELRIAPAGTIVIDSESEETEVKKDIEWLKEQVKEEYEYNREKHNKEGFEGYAHREFAFKYALGLLDQLDEPEVEQLDRKIEELESYNDELIRDNNQLRDELDNQEVLSQAWIDKNKKYAGVYDIEYYIPVDKLYGKIVPKQEEVDQAYKDGYEKGKQHATEKQSEETETVARVLVDYLIASAKLKLALKMEVEELEEC